MNQWKWRAGEHVTTIGPTGSGKTVLNRYLLRRRKFVIVLGVKRRDSELYPPFQADGYKLVHKFDLDEDSPDNDPKVLFVPLTDKHGRESRLERQRKFRNAINDIMDSTAEQGKESWTIYADDVQYMSDALGLRTEFEEVWVLGRSEGVTMVASSQEPVDIPLQAYGMATHLFLFRNNDRRRADRMAELTGINRDVARETILRLPPHQFLYVNRETGQLLTSIVIR